MSKTLNEKMDLNNTQMANFSEDIKSQVKHFDEKLDCKIAEIKPELNETTTLAKSNKDDIVDLVNQVKVINNKNVELEKNSFI